jgi:O-antigen/teichoic acid export membrane protein
MLDTIIFPEMQYEIGLKNINKAAMLYRISMIVAICIAFAGVAFLMLFGLWFYGKWTNNQLEVSSTVWNLLVVGILFNAMWWLGGVVYRAFNQPFKYIDAGVVCAVISVAASYVLASLYGMVGIAIGCLLLEVLMAAYVLPNSLKLLNTSMSDFYLQGKNDVCPVSSGCK